MKVKVGVVQESPVFFDKEKTLEKMQQLILKYKDERCDLLVFPESFIPGYPRGFSFGAKVGSRTEEGRKLYTEYHKNSIDLESDDLAKLEKLARDNAMYLVVGITEKVASNGSLYCSMVYLSPTKGLLGVHRKIKPTGTERTIWSEGSGDTLSTYQTSIGKLGGLICWENYMPLARMAMFQKGIEIYIAPTADSRETWTTTMRHIALEGRCFVLGCNQYFTKSMYPEKYQSFMIEEPEEICRGGSVIVSPFGKILAGPIYDSAELLTATLDLDEITNSKLDFDVNGHYARNDIFTLAVKDQPPMKKE
ncbi:MAG: carbon-nitrogen hydrolase family protein [Eudoraea sp.]|nr:carbon-nitrogen hydrolase family protein [Eudoraea sp.]